MRTVGASCCRANSTANVATEATRVCPLDEPKPYLTASGSDLDNAKSVWWRPRRLGVVQRHPGSDPAGSTSRLMVLTCGWPWALQDRRNVQQPGSGKSPALPALVKLKSGCD